MFTVYMLTQVSLSKTIVVVVLISQNEHALRQVYALSNLCEENIETEV